MITATQRDVSAYDSTADCDSTKNGEALHCAAILRAALQSTYCWVGACPSVWLEASSV